MLLALIRVASELEPILDDFGWEVEYTLDWLPANHRAHLVSSVKYEDEKNTQRATEEGLTQNSNSKPV